MGNRRQTDQVSPLSTNERDRQDGETDKAVNQGNREISMGTEVHYLRLG